MRWIEFVKGTPTPDKDRGYRFPAQLTPLDDLKQSLAISELPPELEELLNETDGIQETLNGEIISDLVWSIERIIEDNNRFRSLPDFKDLYMSFDQLLFFSDAGNGDQFAFVILEGRYVNNDIYVWNHENDSRTWIAPNLKTFLQRWLTEQLTL